MVGVLQPWNKIPVKAHFFYEEDTDCVASSQAGPAVRDTAVNTPHYLHTIQIITEMERKLAKTFCPIIGLCPDPYLISVTDGLSITYLANFILS